MIRPHRMLLPGVVVAAAIFLAAPAWATISRDVVFMDYAGALGGTIEITVNGGKTTEGVYVGPYQFNIFDATIDSGNLVKKTPLQSILVMFCDSASYNLVMSNFPYVELQGADVLNGSAATPYGRLYSQLVNSQPIDAAVALETYERMAWAFNYAMGQGTQGWYQAAQVYMWELWSDAVTGEHFSITGGQFQVISPSSLLSTNVTYLRDSAGTNMLPLLNVPVSSVTVECDKALYKDISTGACTNNSNLSQEFITGAVPEPGTLLLLGLGLAAFALWARWHRG
jgi:hypothetical protein